jgi:hypothetical protein
VHPYRVLGGSRECQQGIEVRSHGTKQMQINSNCALVPWFSRSFSAVFVSVRKTQKAKAKELPAPPYRLRASRPLIEGMHFHMQRHAGPAYKKNIGGATQGAAKRGSGSFPRTESQTTKSHASFNWVLDWISRIQLRPVLAFRLQLSYLQPPEHQRSSGLGLSYRFFWISRGRPQNKIGDPRGGWVGQRPKTDQGQIYFRFILWCFLTPLTEKRPKM